MKVKLRQLILPLVVIVASLGTVMVSRAVKADTNNPNITNVNIGNITDTQATVSWTSTTSDVSFLRYGPVDTDSGRNQTASSSVATTTHQLVLSGLTASTTYFVRVVSGSASASPVESLSYSFRTMAASSSPSITGVAITGVTDTSAVISWTSSVNDVSLIRFGSTDTSSGRNLTASSSAMSTYHQLTLNGLAASTTYFARIVSGSQTATSTESTSYSFTTMSPSSGGGSPISNVNISNITDTGASITWTSSSTEMSMIRYGLTDTTQGRNQVASDNTLTKTHEIDLSGLMASSTYYIRIVSGAPTNPVESVTYTLMTPAASGGNDNGQGDNGYGGYDHGHRDNGGYDNNGSYNDHGNGSQYNNQGGHYGNGNRYDNQGNHYGDGNGRNNSSYNGYNGNSSHGRDGYRGGYSGHSDSHDSSSSHSGRSGGH